jgi:hypothetical protein
LRTPYVDVLTDPKGPPHPLALLALFGRSLVTGTIISVAAWMLISVLLDQFR